MTDTVFTNGVTLSDAAWCQDLNDLAYKGNVPAGSSANGDMFYRAAGALARLAKGAANTKLFTNAGATAPEWAVGIKVGSFTRSMAGASGDVAYTGVGFKPSYIQFIFVNPDVVDGHGYDDGTTHECIYHQETNKHQPNSTNAIYMPDGAGSTEVAIVKTFDADGFTLTWTLAGAGTGVTATIYYTAFR